MLNLEELDLPVWRPTGNNPSPAADVAMQRVDAFLADAERRIDALFASGSNRRLPRFVPADARAVYAALQHITRLDLPVGRVFCEWGSGLGVATCLAALLGYEAYGIEIEPELTELSRRFAEDHGIEAHILTTSYLPEGFESYSGSGATELVTPAMEAGGRITATRYQGMPFETDEIDVFYVYPWPGEQEMMLELFDLIAADGAILLAYYGDGEVAGYRKSAAIW